MKLGQAGGLIEISDEEEEDNVFVEEESMIAAAKVQMVTGTCTCTHVIN